VGAAGAIVGWVLAFAAPARAGDPCPIPLAIGAVPPPWRDAAADLAALDHPRVWLGLTWEDPPGGPVVSVVHAGGPAAAADVRVGDRITAIDGRPVADGAALSAAFDAAETGASIRIALVRDGTGPTVTLRRGPVDPLVYGLWAAAQADRCRAPRLVVPDAGLAAAVVAGAFDAQRAFRCADAHVALRDAAPPGTVLVVRGGSRVLLVSPGSGTLCVGVDEADGADGAQHAAWLAAVTGPYVADRHANP